MYLQVFYEPGKGTRDQVSGLHCIGRTTMVERCDKAVNYGPAARAPRNICYNNRQRDQNELQNLKQASFIVGHDLTQKNYKKISLV